MNRARTLHAPHRSPRLSHSLLPLLLAASCGAPRSELSPLATPAPAIAPLSAPATLRARLATEVRVPIELSYLQTLPRGYGECDASQPGAPPKRWPLIVFLHGLGECGDDLSIVQRHGPPKLLAAGKEIPAIVLSPQAAKPGWLPAAILALIDDACARLLVDESRIVLTGLSMGGYGTWATAIERPDRFAAIVPICGGGDPVAARRLASLPTWVFHGAKDPVVAPAQSRAMVESIERAGGHPKLTVYDDLGHDSWTRAYDDPALWEWMLAQRRAAPDVRSGDSSKGAER